MRNKLSLVVGLTIALGANLAFASKFAPAVSSGEIEPGVWNSSLKKGQDYVKAHPGVPLIAVWSKIGCHNCENFDSNYLTKEPYVTWQKESGIVFVYVNSASWSSTPTELDWISGPSNDGCSPRELTAAPFVRVYWYDPSGKKITDIRFSGLNSNIDGPALEKPQNLINKLMGYLPGWQAKPSYEGGTFVATNVVGACMEAEPTTTTLNIPLTRTATTAYTQTMTIKKQTKLLTATPPESVPVEWKPGDTNMVVKIENFKNTYYTEGAVYDLSLTNAEGEVVSSTIVRCVPAQANSSMNPYWIGEKTAATLAWGDWTMDLEAASNKVAKTAGAWLIM